MFESSSIAWVNFSLLRISCCRRPQSSLAKRGRVYIHGGCVVLSREGFVALGFESVSHDVRCLTNGGQMAEVSCVERKIDQSRGADAANIEESQSFWKFPSPGVIASGAQAARPAKEMGSLRPR